MTTRLIPVMFILVFDGSGTMITFKSVILVFSLQSAQYVNTLAVVLLSEALIGHCSHWCGSIGCIWEVIICVVRPSLPVRAPKPVSYRFCYCLLSCMYITNNGF